MLVRNTDSSRSEADQRPEPLHFGADSHPRAARCTLRSARFAYRALAATAAARPFLICLTPTQTDRQPLVADVPAPDRSDRSRPR